MGARPRGRTATQRSKKGSEKVPGKGSGEGVLRRVLRGWPALGFTVKRVLRRVLRRGSEKAVSRTCLERPLGVRPINKCSFGGLGYLEALSAELVAPRCSAS